METVWCVQPGQIPYEEARLWQLALVEARAEGRIPNVLLLLEHPPTYTLGRAAREEHLLIDEAQLQRLGASLHSIERGGDITYHGPGQLVGYPIIDLRRWERDVHRFLRSLEEVLIHTLADYRLSAHREPGLTGVWVGRDKIAAIGVAFRRWVSYHGLALNVRTDLSYFDAIIPCGITGRGVTSMARLLPETPTVEEVAAAVRRHFADVFHMDVVDGDDEALRRLGLHRDHLAPAG